VGLSDQLHNQIITRGKGLPISTKADLAVAKYRMVFVRFEVFTAVTMKNGIFWDIKPQFVLHRRHITSPLQSPASKCYVRFEVFTAVTMKNGIFWDI
jgi:hypothetical protein